MCMIQRLNYVATVDFFSNFLAKNFYVQKLLTSRLEVRSNIDEVHK